MPSLCCYSRRFSLPTTTQPAIFVGFAAILLGSGLWILLRFGVLPMAVGVFVTSVINLFPMTSDFSAWYAGATIIAFATVLVLAAWSFRVALAGRKLWKAELFES